MTFSFAPTLVIYVGMCPNGNGSTSINYSNGSGLAPQTLTTSFKNLTGISFGNASVIQWKKSSDGKTFYWHIGNNASGYEAYAGNTSGATYFFYGLA